MRAWAFFAGSFLVILTACTSGKTEGVSLVTDKLEVTKSAYTVDGNVPQVRGLTDAAVQSSINAALESMVHGEVDAFVKNDGLAQSASGTSSEQSSMRVEFEAKTLSQHFISILFRFSPYEAGAAHPTSYTLSFNDDVDAKKQLTFADLFKPKSNYLKKVSSGAIVKLTDLSKQNQTYYDEKDQWIKGGAGPDANNFRSWTIENGQLLLTFDPYQVASYAEGEQVISIPRAEIIDVLSDEGMKILSETQETSSK